MKNVLIKRVCHNNDGVFGVMMIENNPRFVTVEPKWFGNYKSISCIPVGTYTCKMTKSPRFGETYEITNVPDRSNILIHWGNFSRDTEGCVIVGSGFDYDLRNGSYITNSVDAFRRFMNLMQKEEFTLVIEDVDKISVLQEKTKKGGKS
jgi:hypothetical protein